jgi:predicted glycosyltransferase
MRRLAPLVGAPLEVWFLTSSEADGLAFAEGFAAFKIPSKTIVHEAGLDRRAYVALAKQWVWHTLGLLRPDLLVVDTFPRGSFGELIGALDLCKHAAFVYRPVRREVAERADFQAMLTLYDLLLVPEENAEVLVPPGARGKVVRAGYVLGRERWELIPRDTARLKLGIRPSSRCVFVSAGGGGDRDAAGQLESVIRALSSDPSLSVVVGTGPLYRGEPMPGATLVPGRAAEWSLAFDAAVSAAGYNTFGELMFAGVPTAFVPQTKLADDQEARAEAAARRGAGVMLGRDWDDARVLGAVRELLERPGARAAARSMVPESSTRHAAAELLGLVCRASEVEQVLAALSDERLARTARTGGVAERSWLALAHHLTGGDLGALGEALDASLTLLESRPPGEAQELLRVTDAVTRAAGQRSVEARAGLVRELLAALGPLLPGDGAAARAVLGAGGAQSRLDRETLRGSAGKMRGHVTPPSESSPQAPESASSSLSTK